VDTDCPANFFCNSIKAKIVRDIKRIGKLEELKEALSNFKKINLRYPTLTAGTYLMNNSVSVWPSWSQVLLSDLAVSQNFLDPINRLGSCQGYNVKTCWDEVTKKFVSSAVPPTLPAGSYAFAYSTDPNGSRYSLCAVLETREPALQYNFSPNNPAGSNCVTAIGIGDGGTATNTPPQFVTSSLTSEASQPFNGFIKVIDAESNPLTWSLNTFLASDWTNNGWSAAPVLQDTSNPNQKKIYAAKAGKPFTYRMNLTVTDSQGGILSTSTPITIVSPGPLIEADDEEFVLDPTIPFKYSFTFSGDNIDNPTASTSVIRKLSGSDYLDLFSSAGFTKTFSTVGTNKYQITTTGIVPFGSGSEKFPQTTDLKYRLSVRDKYSNISTKDFTIKLIATNPALDFNCPVTVRVNKDYDCPLGSTVQGNHTLAYSGTVWPQGLSISNPSSATSHLQGRLMTISAGLPVTIKATNEYGAFSTKSFTLKVNSYCGDGIKQAPNNEERGGIYNDGYEDCDIAAGVAFNVPSSNIDNQYGCMTDSSDTPDPILTNTYCIFKSPAPGAGGGFCGDGICQTVINDQSMENCKNCSQDCGECVATIQSDANQEQIAYFNGQKMYKAVYPMIGSATRTVPVGDNVIGFWVHNNNDYGLAYRILIGPVNNPYDVIDTTNSSLKCAPAAANTHNFSGSLSDVNYDPSSELVNGSYNWTQKDFAETGSFANSMVTSMDSQIEQISLDGQTTPHGFLPYVWGAKLNPVVSSAYYCRLIYNLDTMGLCQPKCLSKECGADGCGNLNGCGSCAVRYPNYNQAQTECSSAGKCVCTPQCAGKTCGSDGCGGICGACSGNQVCTNGQCVCTPNCSGKTCGSDGCGGSCGSCSGNQVCTNNQCICTPNCSGKVCGDNGCGGSCGSCSGNQVCTNGQCICTPSCSGKCIGDSDGCGSTCSVTDPPTVCARNSTTACSGTFSEGLPAHCSSITVAGVKTCNSSCTGWSDCTLASSTVEDYSSTACDSTSPQMNGYSCCDLISCEKDGCGCCGRNWGAAVPSGFNMIKSLSPCGLTNQSCKLTQSTTNNKNWIITTNHTTAKYKCWR
jgi:hypothetical protein